NDEIQPAVIVHVSQADLMHRLVRGIDRLYGPSAPPVRRRDDAVQAGRTIVALVAGDDQIHAAAGGKDSAGDAVVVGVGKGGRDVSNPRPSAGVAAGFAGIFVPDDIVAVAACDVDPSHASADIEQGDALTERPETYFSPGVRRVLKQDGTPTQVAAGNTQVAAGTYDVSLAIPVDVAQHDFVDAAAAEDHMHGPVIGGRIAAKASKKILDG